MYIPIDKYKMQQDVLYCFQTKFRIWDKAIIKQMITQYEQQFGIKAHDFHELFLEGKIIGEDAKRFMYLYEYLIVNYK